MKVGVVTNHFLIIALTSIRATIYAISSTMMESIYMNKIFENNDNSKKMLKVNSILSNALLYLHETPFSFASSPYVISFQSLIKMLCNNILKHILCPGHVTGALYNQPSKYQSQFTIDKAVVDSLLCVYCLHTLISNASNISL